MIVGGVWSLISLTKPLVSGVKASLAAYRSAKTDGTDGILRTEFDTPMNYVHGEWRSIGLIPVFGIFYYALGDYPGKGRNRGRHDGA